MQGKLLKYVDSIKFLGVHIDNGLTFQGHIDKKIKSAKLMLTKVAATQGRDWGPKGQILKWAYNMVIKPSLSYLNQQNK